MLILIPIKQTIEENKLFADMPECSESLQMTIDYYKVIGYVPPWIGYYAKLDSKLVGSAAYKGIPVNNKIEIAYNVFPEYQNKGIGAAICQELVTLALQTDPQVIITARTLPEKSYSSQLLKRNGFVLVGTIWDKDDGDVWEWKFNNNSSM